MGLNHSLQDDMQSHKMLIGMNTQLSQLNALEQLYLAQKKESGEAQAATEARNNKLVELERWCGDYKAVAENRGADALYY